MSKEKIFNLINKNPVCLIQNFSNFDFLVEDYGSKIFSVYRNNSDAFYSYKKNKSEKFKTGYSLEKNSETEQDNDIVFCSSEFFYHHMMRMISQHIFDFCSIIILNDFEKDFQIYSVIVNLWIEMYKISKVRPYLILSSKSDILPYTPFPITSVNSLKLKVERDVKIYFNEKNYTPSDNEMYDEMVKKIKNYYKFQMGKNIPIRWLIYVTDENISKKISRNIYEMDEERNEIILVKENKNIIQSLDKKEKNIFLILNNTDQPLCFEDVNGVFDCMTEKDKFGENNIYISKSETNFRMRNLKNGFCYKMCTEGFYENLFNTDLSSIDKKNIDKIILKIISYDLNPISVLFYNFNLKKINKKLDYLENLNLIFKVDDKNYKITELGKFSLTLPFSVEQNIVIYKWEGNSLTMVVMSSVIETNKRLHREEENLKKDILFENLNLIIKYLSHHKTIKIKESLIKIFCNENNIIFENMLEVLNLIKLCCDKLNIKSFDFNFDLEDLLEKSKNIYEKVYFNNSCIMVDRKNNVYVNKEKKLYTILNKLENFPSKIINLKLKYSERKEKDIIRLYLKLE